MQWLKLDTFSSLWSFWCQAWMPQEENWGKGRENPRRGSSAQRHEEQENKIGRLTQDTHVMHIQVTYPTQTTASPILVSVQFVCKITFIFCAAQQRLCHVDRGAMVLEHQSWAASITALGASGITCRPQWHRHVTVQEGILSGSRPPLLALPRSASFYPLKIWMFMNLLHIRNLDFWYILFRNQVLLYLI